VYFVQLKHDKRKLSVFVRFRAPLQAAVRMRRASSYCNAYWLGLPSSENAELYRLAWCCLNMMVTNVHLVASRTCWK
jgi:hypothetical protein